MEKINKHINTWIDKISNIGANVNYMNVFDDKPTGSEVFKLYTKNFKLILFTVTVCTVLAFVVSLLLTPRYRAKASFFIPYNISLEAANENPQFGFDIEADRLLQLLTSEQFKDSVIKKFNLITYWELDTMEDMCKEKIREMYGKRIFTNRTKDMSILVEAETKDPQFSTQIVDFVVGLAYRMRERVLKTNGMVAVNTFQKDYLKKQKEVDSLRTRIIEIRKSLKHSNVALVNSQLLWGKEQGMGLQPELEVELEVLSQKHINEYNRLNDLKGKYENALNLYNRPIPQFYIVDKAYPIYRPSYPLTGFNMGVAFFGSLFFMLSAIYVRHVISTIRNYFK